MAVPRIARRLAAAGLLALACLPAAPAAAQDDTPRIAPGVFAGGVDLSGLTADEAAALLERRLTARTGRAVRVRVAGRRFTLRAGTAKVRLDAARTAKRALRAAEPPPPDSQAAGGQNAGVEVPLALSHSRLAVRAFARTVGGRVHRAPRNATLRIGLKRMTLRRARLGVSLDTVKLARRIDAALADPGLSRSLSQRVRRTVPPVNANDLRRRYRTVITVSKREFRLRLFKNLRWRKSYGVAVGQPAYPTPEGRFSIQSKQVNPVWSVPNSPWAGELAGSRVAGGSASNPLKARWMGVAGGVGIHGTGEDWSIGSAASHGCIRMHVWDVVDLYRRVPVGTPVLIR